jgi:hypothetical protein
VERPPVYTHRDSSEYTHMHPDSCMQAHESTHRAVLHTHTSTHSCAHICLCQMGGALQNPEREKPCRGVGSCQPPTVVVFKGALCQCSLLLSMGTHSPCLCPG